MTSMLCSCGSARIPASPSAGASHTGQTSFLEKNRRAHGSQNRCEQRVRKERLSGAFATCQHALQRSSEEMISDVWVDAMADRVRWRQGRCGLRRGAAADPRQADAEATPFLEFSTRARAQVNVSCAIWTGAP